MALATNPTATATTAASGIAPMVYGSSASDAYSGMSQQLQQAIDVINEYLSKSIGYLQPFYDVGLEGLSAFQKGLTPLGTPVQLMNQLMSQYQPSQYAQAQIASEEEAANAAAAASGMLGSGAEQQALQQSAQTITSKDMSKWLDYIFRTYGGYLKGQQNLMSQGFQSGKQMGGWTMQGGEDIADIMGTQAMADMLSKLAKSIGSMGSAGFISGIASDIGGMF